MRLKAKAEQMLKNITDVKERQELPLPAIFDGSRQKPGTVTVNNQTTHRGGIAMQKSVTKHATSSLAVQKLLSGDVAFHDMPAIMRTPEGMAEFYRLQHELNADSASHDQLVQDLRDRIHEEDDQESEGDTPELLFADGEIGRKRKM